MDGPAFGMTCHKGYNGRWEPLGHTWDQRCYLAATLAATGTGSRNQRTPVNAGGSLGWTTGFEPATAWTTNPVC
jgi:hypothetical protein